ncbi:RWD domain-containing protein 3 isoform X2 [Seriola lalandi dorsalis]|uniref:RWD domain-containing protein 3 isoform X2 n=1 Tax=Seriola lalandi dorsalis TaxID=1841481 RepID=UPI000C6FA4FF|nr:RWD domain-containing protein 3 isoform X2 [Seriola lalandi dorsalis]XP_056231579.1 RWD domain-containing protein 3 isoform X2 [Seriola aureovittata]
MSEAAVEEVSVLSAIYCGEGEFRLIQQSAQDGLLVQINTTVPGERGLNLSLLFHLHPQYPSCPPDISVSSTAFSRNQCHSIRQRLLERAAALPPEPMVHQLVDWLQQSEEVTEGCRGAEEEVKDRGREERWTAVLSLDHIRSRSRYIGLLERWSQQLQLPGRLLLGQSILVILQGARADIKEFCRLLKTVKVDVDSSGKKCKERMMKVLIETPSYSSCGHGLQRFVVKEYQSSAELTAVFQELHMTELYQQILPSLSD